MSVIHLKKKDIVKSSVKGVVVEFDHEKSATILVYPEPMEFVKEEAQEEEGNQADFDWEAVIDEAAVEGESGSGEKFYDAEDEAQGSPEVNDEIPAAVTHASAQQKEKESSGVDPSCPTGRIPEAVMTKFQAEFERARANGFQAELENAQAENARLLALLQQAQSKPKP
ncbi:hypothetical protein Dimus_003588 [Dionaea muscipula]